MKKLHHRKLRVWLPVLLLIIVVTVYTGNFMSLNSLSPNQKQFNESGNSASGAYLSNHGSADVAH